MSLRVIAPRDQIADHRPTRWGPSMRFADLTYEELRDLVPDVDAVFVPLGCTEQQGPHLPTDFDTWMITRLCADIADRLRQEYDNLALVLPTLPFGPTPEHKGFGYGYINLRDSTHEAVLEDVLHSLAEQGFTTLIVWRGCGQFVLDRVIDRFNAGHADCVAYRPVIDYPAIAEAAFGGQVPGGHADSFATSIRLHLVREDVREDRIRMPELKPVDWDGQVDSAAISDTGVVGNPTRASAAAGAQIWERCVREGADVTHQLISGRSDRVRQEWRFE